MANQGVSSAAAAAAEAKRKALEEAKKRAAEAAKRAAAEAAKKAAADAAKRAAAEVKKRSGAETKYANGQEQFFKRGEKNRPSTRFESAKGASASKGPSASQVRDSQEKLNLWLTSIGHPERQVAVDGKLGPDMRQMLEYFQSVEKLPKTGVLDAKTLERLGDRGADAIQAGIASRSKQAGIEGEGQALTVAARKALEDAKHFISDHKDVTHIGNAFKAGVEKDLPALMKKAEALAKEKPSASRNEELRKVTQALQNQVKGLDAMFQKGAREVEAAYQVATKAKAGADLIMNTLGNAAPGVKAAYNAITAGIGELQKDGSLERRLLNAVLASGTSAALSRWGDLAGSKTQALSAKFLAGAASAVTSAASTALRGAISLDPGDPKFDEKWRTLAKNAAADAVFGTAGAALSTAFEKNLRDKADKALGELKPLLDKLDKKDPAYAAKKEALFRDALKNAVLSAAAPFERKISAQEKLAKEVVKQVPALAASIQKELNALPPNDPKWGEHAMGIINKHLVTAASNIAINAAKDPVLAADFGGNGNKIRDAALSLLQTIVQKPLVEAGAKAAQGAPPPKA